MAIFEAANPSTLAQTCPGLVTNVLNVYDLIDKFILFTTVTGVGYLTAVIQDLSIIRLLNNVKLNLFSLLLQFSIFIVSSMLLIMKINIPENNALTVGCKDYVEITALQTKMLNSGYSIIIGETGELNFQVLMSCTTFLYTIIMIFKL